MVIETLVRGEVPSSFPFSYESDFDPASPYSLCIAFLPETAQIRTAVFKSIECPKTDTLDPEIAQYVSAECARKGWVSSLQDHDSTVSYFYKVRLRITDDAYRNLTIPALEEGVDSVYTDGILRTLLLYRKLSTSNNSGDFKDISLVEYEELDATEVFELLISVPNPKWTLRQRLDIVVLPYLTYKGRLDILADYISDLPQELLVDCGFERWPELYSAVLRNCLSLKARHYKTVQKCLDKVEPYIVQNVNDVVDLTNLNSKTYELMQGLVQAASTQKFSDYTFLQLADWSQGSVAVQEDLFIKVLFSSASFNLNELRLLKSHLFIKVDEEYLISKSIYVAIRRSKFMFLKSVSVEYSHLVNSEVQKICDEYLDNPDLELSQVLTSLEIANIDANLKKKYEIAQKLYQLYDIDPRFTMTQRGTEVLSRVLAAHPRAYLKFSELKSVICQIDGATPDQVAQLCVEAALADDNFTAVQELVDTKLECTPENWLAYYQAGKFISVEWDSQRPVHILKKQRKYLSTCLKLCSESDLISVLSAWNTLDSEYRTVMRNQNNQSSSKSSSKTSSRAVSQGSQVAPTESHGEERRKRDQISNLLVSGLGWAIGANQ